MASTYRVYRVLRALPEGEAGVTLIFDGALPAQAGQFVMTWLPGVDERPFTVMNDDPLMLTIATVGPFTRALSALAPGDRLWVRGPHGNGFQMQGERPLLLAGGSGAATIGFLARVLRDRGQPVTVALGARRRSLMMLAWRFRELGCDLLLATDDGSSGFHGTVVDAASGLLSDKRVDAVYACGPERMLCALAARVQAIAAAQGSHIPCQVSLEAVMKCGMGICGNCHHGENLICRHGPVFDAAVLGQCAADAGPKVE